MRSRRCWSGCGGSLGRSCARSARRAGAPRAEPRTKNQEPTTGGCWKRDAGCGILGRRAQNQEPRTNDGRVLEAGRGMRDPGPAAGAGTSDLELGTKHPSHRSPLTAHARRAQNQEPRTNDGSVLEAGRGRRDPGRTAAVGTCDLEVSTSHSSRHSSLITHRSFTH